MEEVGRRFAEGAGEQDGAVCLLSEFVEGGQATEEAGDGTARVKDEQAGVEATDGAGEVIDDGGEREGMGTVLGVRDKRDGWVEEQDAAGVASCGLQAGFDGGGGGVVGGEEDDGSGFCGCGAGKGFAARDAGGQGEGYEGGIAAGGGIE